jgi:Tfp pilus assembly protein PilO
MIKKLIPHEVQQTLVVGIVVILGFLYGGGSILYKNSSKEMRQYKQKRERVIVENRIGQQLSSLQKMRQEMAALTESSRFLAEIAKLSAQLNLKLKSISAIPVEKRPEYIRLGVSLEIDTDYHELGIFVSKLESSDLLINIDKLEVLLPSNNKDALLASRIDAKMVVTTIALTDTLLEK